jgi:hypothetical protein
LGYLLGKYSVLLAMTRCHDITFFIFKTVVPVGTGEALNMLRGVAPQNVDKLHIYQRYAGSDNLL